MAKQSKKKDPLEIERTNNIRKQQIRFNLGSATILISPGTGLSGILHSVRTQYSTRSIHVENTFWKSRSNYVRKQFLHHKKIEQT